ncbi:MAG: biosynthetic peptidoglycan transglycosylase, partial [Limnochordia bacterium]
MLAWLKRYRLTILALFLLMLLPFAVVFIKGYFTIRAFDIGRPMQTAVVFDREGRFIGALGETGRYVTIDAIPQDLADAVVAVEDFRFYKHSGVDIIGIARALVANLRAGETVQGGSTITQQVAKNLFLTPRRTLKRKFEELALALLLEARFSKEQILELYL